MHEARAELHRILVARELQDAVLLVYANKQDLSQSVSVEEVRERLQLDRFPHRTWTVQSSVATSGDGLMEGFTWLAERLRKAPASAPSHLPAIEAPPPLSVQEAAAAAAAAAAASSSATEEEAAAPSEGAAP